MLVLVRCWYSQPILVGKTGVSIALYGVPGQVRTANLPLRRGMLYPIELLRRYNRQRALHSGMASMLTSMLAFVMPQLGFFA